MKRIFEIVTIVEEQRSYVIEAGSLEEAEEMALCCDVEPRKVETLDYFIHDSKDATESYRDYDAENDADRAEVGR